MEKKLLQQPLSLCLKSLTAHSWVLGVLAAIYNGLPARSHYITAVFDLMSPWIDQLNAATSMVLKSEFHIWGEEKYLMVLKIKVCLNFQIGRKNQV